MFHKFLVDKDKMKSGWKITKVHRIDDNQSSFAHPYDFDQWILKSSGDNDLKHWSSYPYAAGG